VTDTDADLVQRARAGDRDAFAVLLERHSPMAHRVCARLLGAAGGLDDVLQETALQAWLGLGSLRDARQFGAWLAGIGLNLARHSLRARAQDAWSWEAIVGGKLVREPVERAAGPAELAEAEELARHVRAAVADLPPGQRAAVLLVYLSGLSYRETAAALGIPVGALKTRLHKGRRALQRRLVHVWTEELMTMTSLAQEMIEMRVVDVRRRGGHDEHPRSIVVLEEVGGARQVPIWVGTWEGDSIAMLLEKVRVPRPLTHAFAANLLRAGGVRVRHVRIHRLANETYYADVALEGGAGQQSVDARPSDSIALALEVGAPIFVASEVLAAAEAARAARAEAGQPEPTIGAAEIVDHLIEQWPTEPRPVR
jgi:RNA polymerase sigma-70 factor (ECF subfamily)